MTFFEKLNNLISTDFAIGWAFLLIWIACMTFGFIAVIVHHFLLAIPLYIMADKAGYAYPILAYIPFANYYLIHIIPMREYNFIGLYKTYERRNGFLIYLASTYIAPFVMFVLCAGIMVIPIISYLFTFVSPVVSLALTAIMYISRTIMVKDLVNTYIDDKGISIVLGIISCFVPLVLPISVIFLCTKEPEFGFGNYYYPERGMDSEEEE